MMILDVDKKLADMGFVKIIENEDGFQYLKKIGTGIAMTVAGSRAFNGEFKLLAYDNALSDYVGGHLCAMGLTESELRIFANKMKEWRKKYEKTDE